MISWKHLRLLAWFLICVAAISCGRRKLRPDELARNQLYAEITYRTDHRTLGEDGFFPQNLLAAPHPVVSRWSAIALGRIGDPQALPWLYLALRKPDAGVRAAAAFAIGEIEDRGILEAEGRKPDPDARRELLRLLDDPAPFVRMRAMEALGKAALPADLPALMLCVRDPGIDGAAERQAFLDLGIISLLRIGDAAALPLLKSLAADADPQIQWRAANALVRLHDRSARPVFLDLLKDPDVDVRTYGARGIGICGIAADSRLLQPMLATRVPGGDKSNPLPLRIAAVEALASLRSVDSVPAIVEALRTEPPDEKHPDQLLFGIRAAAALGDLGGPQAITRLTQLLKGPAALQRAAVVALAKAAKQQPELFFELVRGLDVGSSPGMRAWAQALGEIGGPRACEELTSLLARAIKAGPGSDPYVAVPAILEAMSRAGALGFEDSLQPFLQSPDGIILRTALRLRRPRAGETRPWALVMEAYRRIAGGSDAESKVAVLNCLRPWAGEGEVQDLLRAALGDRSRNARIAAAALLRSIGAAEVPQNPGPAESTLTRLTCTMLATARLDRTVAIIATDKGAIEIELFREDAPVTTSAFIRLARSGFYNGLSFMRVVPFFVIQGGDPRNDQEGGPGYSLRCEINMRPFDRGSVGMALAGKDTGGSQFFITLSPQPHLDGSYTCFGRVISGMQVADHIVPGDVIRNVRIEDDVTMLDYRYY